MDYVSIKAAQASAGLALVVNAGVPGPWSESAKALFRHHQIPFLAVPQIPAAANDALVEWTGHRNAPIAVYPGEAPMTRALELLQLAERLGQWALLAAPSALFPDSGDGMDPRDRRRSGIRVVRSAFDF